MTYGRLTGRRKTKPTLDEVPAFRLEHFLPYMGRYGSTFEVRHGEKLMFQVTIGSGYVTLYRSDIKTRLDLLPEPKHFGGFQYYVACPNCQARRRVLVALGERFMCHKCSGLNYASQTHNKLRQAQWQQHLIIISLGGNDPYHFPPRPKWQRKATYKKACDRFSKYFMKAEKAYSIFELRYLWKR